MPRKNRGRVQKKQTAYSMAKKALAAVKKQRPEVKSWDFTVANGTGITNAGTIYRPTYLLEQGTQWNQRVGQRIHITSMTARGMIAGNSSATLGATTTRIIFLIDKEMDGIIASVADVLQVPNDLRSQYNPDARGRFKILEDTMVTNCVNSPTAVRPFVRKWRINRKCHFGQIGTGADLDSYQGQPLLLIIGDQATNNPNFGMQIRVNFTDC